MKISRTKFVLCVVLVVLAGLLWVLRDLALC